MDYKKVSASGFVTLSLYSMEVTEVFLLFQAGMHVLLFHRLIALAITYSVTGILHIFHHDSNFATILY